MTQIELLTAALLALLASISTGQRTVDQLRRQLADGLAYVDRVGGGNVERELLIALAAMDGAIQRIERVRVKYDRLKGN